MKFITMGELPVMRYLWAMAAPKSVRDITLAIYRRKHRDLTVQNMLFRLMEKKYVSMTDGEPNRDGEIEPLYFATVTQKEYAWLFLRELYVDKPDYEIAEKVFKTTETAETETTETAETETTETTKDSGDQELPDEA